MENHLIKTFSAIIVYFSCFAFSQIYRGAELRTLDPVLYGKFEARYKPAQGEGLVSSFFVYNDDFPNTSWVEVDVEILGRFPNIVDMNVITNTSHLRTHFTTLDTHIDFHEYGFEWTPDYVAWFINGEEVYRQTEDHIGDLIHPAKIMMNIWNPTFDDWVGIWDDRVLPRFAFYDWVRYSSYTPGNGDTGTENNFTFQWEDDFDDFDDNRWEISHNHTWGGNQALFIEENAIFENGYLVLCLTDNENIGFQDQEKPHLLWARADGDSIVVQFSEELDPETAQNVGSYTIPGVLINSATLMNDQRTVHLQVTDMILTEDYTLYIIGINDDSDPPNTQTTQSIAIDMPNPISFPLKINVAGEGFNDFSPDQLWSSSVEYGHMNGNYQITDANIGNTVEETIYQTSLNRVVSYKARVPKGEYSVLLKLSENHYNQIGIRSYDVYAEDSLWISNLDVFQQANIFTAFDTILDGIIVEDGILDLYFSAVNYGAGYEYAGPFINGLEINLVQELSNDFFQAKDFSISSPYPNPFNNKLTIPIEVKKHGEVRIEIFNISGQLLDVIHRGHLGTGNYELIWDAKNYSSGLYIIQTSLNNKIKYEKTILLK
ncbi:MAG: family 16 glycosylhydrolase [Candidatus Neomarinimicrobiota bacterium]